MTYLRLQQSYIKEIIAILALEQGINTLKDNLAEFNAKETKNKEQISLENTKNLLDTLVLLANSLNLLKQLGELNIDQLLTQIYTGGRENIETQIQVLQNQIVSLTAPEEEEDDQEEEKDQI